MDNLLCVAFEAHNDERNHHRRYELRLGRDLFGVWTVTLSYGRTGRVGQEVRHSAAGPDALRRVIRESLRRRRSAPRRIDCSYRLTAVTAADGIEVGDWLPADSLAAFVS